MVFYVKYASAVIILLGFLSGTFTGLIGIIIYIIGYYISIFIIFIFLLSSKLYYISDFQNFYKFNPLVALCLSLSFFSIAGIPPLAGFFGKFYILLSLIE